MLPEISLTQGMSLVRIVDSLMSWTKQVVERSLTNDYAWDDLQGEIANGTGVGSLTYENYRDTTLKLYHWRHDQADELGFAYQMSHRWAGTIVKPHLHVIPLAPAGGTVAIQIQWVWGRVGEEVPVFSKWSTRNIRETFSASDRFREKIIRFGEIAPPPGAGASSILYIHSERVPADDTYDTSKGYGTAAANLALVSHDVHYQATRMGTVTEFGAY